MNRKQRKERLARLNAEKKMKRKMEKHSREGLVGIIAHHAHEAAIIRESYLENKEPANLKIVFVGGMTILFFNLVFVVVNISSDNALVYLKRLLVCAIVVFIGASIACFVDMAILFAREYKELNT